MHLVDVIALTKENGLLYPSGDYRSIAMIPNGDPIPSTAASGYMWVKIARNVSPDEAQAIMNQYPHATQAK